MCAEFPGPLHMPSNVLCTSPSGSLIWSPSLCSILIAAPSKSLWYTIVLSSRMAYIPASVASALRSAPLDPPAFRDQFQVHIFFQAHTFGIDLQYRLTCIPARQRNLDDPVEPPGPQKAGSSMSSRLVAAMIFTSPRASKPSISARSCMRVL